VLDYEARREIHFTIKATDDGMPPGHFEKDISLKIIDVNEAPSGLYISDNIVSETNIPYDFEILRSLLCGSLYVLLTLLLWFVCLVFFERRLKF
jgi:hypothetical protein